MNHQFSALVELLHPAFLRMMAREPVIDGGKPDYGLGDTFATKGVYLFTEAGKHLYVGRSNRLYQRYQNHWGPAKTERQAAFAFRLAREPMHLR